MVLPLSLQGSRLVRLLLAVLMCCVLSVSPAAAQTEPSNDPTEAEKPQTDTLEDVFKQLDLFGTWAADCKQPPSPTNPHVNIASPAEGLVIELHDLGPGYAANQYSVLTVEPMAGNRVKVQMLFQPGAPEEEKQTLVFQLGNGTRRTMFNQPQGGPPRVKDGLVVGRKTKTPTLKKCL